MNGVALGLIASTLLTAMALYCLDNNSNTCAPQVNDTTIAVQRHCGEPDRIVTMRGPSGSYFETWTYPTFIVRFARSRVLWISAPEVQP